MQTSHVTEWLHEYLDGELSPEFARRVQAHVSTCAACEERLNDLRAVHLALSDLAEVEPPPGFHSRLMARVDAIAAAEVERVASGARAPVARPVALPIRPALFRWARVGAAAAAIVVAAGTGTWMLAQNAGGRATGVDVAANATPGVTPPVVQNDPTPGQGAPISQVPDSRGETTNPGPAPTQNRETPNQNGTSVQAPETQRPSEPAQPTDERPQVADPAPSTAESAEPANPPQQPVEPQPAEPSRFSIASVQPSTRKDFESLSAGVRTNTSQTAEYDIQITVAVENPAGLDGRVQDIVSRLKGTASWVNGNDKAIDYVIQVPIQHANAATVAIATLGDLQAKTVNLNDRTLTVDEIDRRISYLHGQLGFAVKGEEAAQVRAAIEVLRKRRAEIVESASTARLRLTLVPK